jgi:hypothetical protein
MTNGRIAAVVSRTGPDAAGACTVRTVPDGPGTIHMAGMYLGS